MESVVVGDLGRILVVAGRRGRRGRRRGGRSPLVVGPGRGRDRAWDREPGRVSRFGRARVHFVVALRELMGRRLEVQVL